MLLVLLVMLLGSITTTHAQDPSKTAACSMVSIPFYSPVSHWGGKYITSAGTLRVLVVFVKFADDNETSPTWPNPSVLPTWAQNIVDVNYSASGNYTANRMSKYFYENSYGVFHVIGDVYYVTATYSEDYYHQVAGNSSAVAARGALETEVFNKLAASPYSVNFTRYDNWHSNSDSVAWANTAGADGVLDMCWFITRNLHDENYQSPLQIGVGWATLDCPSISEGGVLIKGSDYYFPASGISGFGKTLSMPLSPIEAADGSYTVVNFLAHEMTHYLFGTGHFATLEGQASLASNRSISSMKGYAGGWQGHYSGYEKWRLQWLTPTLVNANVDGLQLYDQATTTSPNQTRLVQIPIDANQFFLVENRRWISNYESRYAHLNTSPNAKLRPGLVVYHIISESDDLPSTTVKIIDAEGRYDWTATNYQNTPYNPYDDVLDKVSPDPVNGYDEREFVYINGRQESLSNGWRIGWWPNSNLPYGGGNYRYCVNMQDVSTPCRDFDGDSLNVFSVGDVISPWSNPASHKWSGTTFAATTIGVQATSFDPVSQAYTLSVRVTNPEQLAPSKPQGMNTSWNSSGQIVSSWNANQEPGMLQGGTYDLFRAVYYSGATLNYSKLNVSPINGNSYIDNSGLPTGLPNGVDLFLRYHCVARDNTGKLSVPSTDSWLYLGRTAAGTISSNTAYSGTYLITGTLTVNGGATLTISGGTTIRMTPGIVLYINGQLTANGSTGQPITFDQSGTSAYYGVCFNSGSSGSLSYCTFNHATTGITSYSSNLTISNSSFTNSTGGITCSGASPSISGCLFTNNYFGIYLVNYSNPDIENCDIESSGNSGMYLSSSAPTIRYNTIRNSSQSGIWFHNYSSPSNIYHNNISGSSYGFYCDGQSSPQAIYGCNAVYCGYTQVYAYYGCLPLLGNAYNSGLNSFDGYPNDYVIATSSSIVTAVSNWWGTASPVPTKFYADGTSSVVWSPALTYDPNPGRPKVDIESPTATATPFADSTLNLAYQTYQAGRYSDAVALFLKVYQASSSSPSSAKQALLFLADAYERSGQTDFLTYLTHNIAAKASTIPDLTIAQRELQAHWLTKGGRYSEAVAIEMGIIQDFSSNADASKFALFNMGETYNFCLNDPVNAKSILQEFVSKYPGDRLAGLAGFILASSAGAPGTSKLEPGGSKSSSSAMPMGFAIEPNYPNPFNPSTEIHYSLADAGNVSLVIYDILGREIATLANGSQPAGRYTVTWNSQSSGIPVSSGMYFARLRVLNDLGGVKFAKTIKLLLTR
ncbi:MAG TPA: right-handed parallel beta-helix repeat-containing protein [Bacteroidota bacterium]|nr:right-handed parallel beta-helix repeat-containing protein [Bacteroidota bacterium]